MITDANEQAMIEFACRGNAEAVDFVNRAWWYFHAIDDLVDEANLPAEFKVKVMIAGQELFTHIYFARNAVALNAILRNIASTYMDSVAWEKSADADKSQYAEVWRHVGLELLFVVADLCGGWEHRRAVCRDWREYNLNVAKADRQAAGGK